MVAAMSETLPHHQNSPNQPENDLLVWNTSAESGIETQSDSQSTRKGIGRLAISETELNEMSSRQDSGIVDKLKSFYRDFRELSRPKKRVVSAYCVFVDPTVPSPGCLYPPSADHKHS